MTIDRRGFLSGVGAAALAASGTKRAAAAVSTRTSVAHAIVLSGGGALGAYEGGLIDALASRAGISDGQTLSPYSLVCGTSIGALNGWFVATGQYTKLRDLWGSISRERILRLKPKYNALTQETSGLYNRLSAAVRLLLGLTKDELAVAQTAPALDWLRSHVDPRLPTLIPFIWAVTNLTQQRSEFFYRLPEAMRGIDTQSMLEALRVTLGPEAVVREATDDILHKALFASAAIPIVFDPVVLPNGEGADAAYVDGGVASNSSVGIAHTFARDIHVVLLEPPVQDAHYTSALEIGLGAYSTMQRKIIEVEMRDVYFQSVATRELKRVDPQAAAKLIAAGGPIGTFLQHVPPSDLAYLRPEKTLPGNIASFDRQDLLDQCFAIGQADAARGFTPYDWETFRV